MDALVVGIDVSKAQLDVHVRPSGETFVVARNGAGLDELVARLKAIAPAVIAVEATGGFECVVTAALAGAGLPVVVVNPAQVRAFANALGKRAKTDPIDAAVIAHCGVRLAFISWRTSTARCRSRSIGFVRRNPVGAVG